MHVFSLLVGLLGYCKHTANVTYCFHVQLCVLDTFEYFGRYLKIIFFLYCMWTHLYVYNDIDQSKKSASRSSKMSIKAYTTI